MTQITAQPPSELQKASEEITDSTESKWKKALLLGGGVALFGALGLLIKGLGLHPIMLVPAALSTAMIVSFAAALLARGTSRQEKAVSRSNLIDKWAIGITVLSAAPILYLAFGNEILAEHQAAQHIVQQAKSGVTNVMWCENALIWPESNLLPYKADVCLAGKASPDQQGGFSIDVKRVGEGGYTLLDNRLIVFQKGRVVKSSSWLLKNYTL